MTANWFEAKVKYVKVNEDGREKKVNEAYLLDALSYTEAESRIMHEMESVIKGDYYIVAAANIDRALENLEKSLSTFVVPYEICNLADTQFMDVFPYFSEGEEEIPANLKPLKKEDEEIEPESGF